MDDTMGSVSNKDDDSRPFSGPDPGIDDLVADRPETDGDIDEQELYDEGLAGAAEIDTESTQEDEDIPDGFHVE